MNFSVTPSPEKSKPYKGPESYQIEDELLFFGRNRDADQLIAKILSSRSTLVHAQSGAGKTSLINARIIPGLETRGWSAFRILPQNDPIESTRATTLNYLFPHPAAERQALERAWKLLGDMDDAQTLNQLLDSYDKLKIADGRRRALIEPIQLPSPSGVNTGLDSGLVNPYFCRLLRSGIEIEEFAEHLAAIQQHEQAASPLTLPITGETRVCALSRLLSQRYLLSAYQKLLTELSEPGGDLADFFRRIFKVYGRLRPRLALVLLIDQFEELFTRFINPGQAESDKPTERLPRSEFPTMALRDKFLKQLEGLYQAKAILAKEVSERDYEFIPYLPLRFVISMRDEYIARLSEAYLSENPYHLNSLEKEQATEAIKEPAALFGYTYADDCFDSIIQDLTKNEPFVSPAHLQLVCEKLWNEQGKNLAKLSVEADEKSEVPSIQLETLDRLGMTEGILESFFLDFLNGLDEDERLETLDMLDPLVTPSRTRNIVEREQLINAPFRDGQRRRDLLNKLVSRTIVRTEPRLGGYFVEITHEFLIDPILKSIRESGRRDLEYNRYRSALRTLQRLQGTNIAGTKHLLSSQDFNILHQQRETVRWDSWSAEVMLRGAIENGVSKEALGVWLKTFRPYEQLPSLLSLFGSTEKETEKEAERTLLNLAELRCVNEDREATWWLNPEQVEVVWRSQLTWAVDAEREGVKYWTERVMSNG